MAKYSFDFSAKTKPFTHQVEAIDYVNKRDAVALFDEQGLGKTKIVIEAISKGIAEGRIDGALIVCRKTLIANWQEEINTHSNLKSIVLRGTNKEKGINYMGFAHFNLINYESIQGELERLTMFLRVRKLAMVLDESHAIKNPKSKSAIALFKLAEYSVKRIIISGTPVANRPEDIWSQFYFLDKGNLLGDTFESFKKRYEVDMKSTETFLNNEKLDSLREIITSNSIRRKKNDVLELPEKIFYDQFVQLTGRQELMYNQLNDQLYLEVQTFDGSIKIDQSDDLLKKLLRLVQLSSNPKLIDESYVETPAKFLLLDQLVRDIVANDEKVIIWSCFVENIKSLKKRYAEFGALTIFGELNIDQRNDNVRLFKTQPDKKVLIANPAAAKEGLTLTVANNAIYLDRNFNLVDYLQSQDRIHRISQTKICKVIKLIATGTIDEFIDEILSRKHYVANFLQGGKDDVQFSPDITKDELLSYLSPEKHVKEQE
jgi:SWI/SNF-related matrix-associated actin-dependent regulator of chromatin subfamily A-like protein 1